MGAFLAEGPGPRFQVWHSKSYDLLDRMTGVGDTRFGPAYRVPLVSAKHETDTGEGECRLTL